MWRRAQTKMKPNILSVHVHGTYRFRNGTFSVHFVFYCHLDVFLISQTQMQDEENKYFNLNLCFVRETPFMFWCVEVWHGIGRSIHNTKCSSQRSVFVVNGVEHSKWRHIPNYKYNWNIQNTCTFSLPQLSIRAFSCVFTYYDVDGNNKITFAFNWLTVFFFIIWNAERQKKNMRKLPVQ